MVDRVFKTVSAMALGSPCTMSGSDAECDGNDTICLHMAREGQAPALTCTCKMGFHMTGTPPVCEAGVCWCILHLIIFFKNKKQKNLY